MLRQESDAVLGAILVRNDLTPFSSEWISWIRAFVTTLFPVQSSAEKAVGTDTFLGTLPLEKGGLNDPQAGQINDLQLFCQSSIPPASDLLHPVTG